MEFNKDLNAWIASTLSDCHCPVCDNKLKLGYQKCTCNQLLNVEKIEKESIPVYLVTQEQDEIADLVQSIERRNGLIDVQDTLV